MDRETREAATRNRLKAENGSYPQFDEFRPWPLCDFCERTPKTIYHFSNGGKRMKIGFVQCEFLECKIIGVVLQTNENEKFSCSYHDGKVARDRIYRNLCQRYVFHGPMTVEDLRANHPLSIDAQRFIVRQRANENLPCLSFREVDKNPILKTDSLLKVLGAISKRFKEHVRWGVRVRKETITTKKYACGQSKHKKTFAKKTTITRRTKFSKTAPVIAYQSLEDKKNVNTLTQPYNSKTRKRVPRADLPAYVGSWHTSEFGNSNTDNYYFPPIITYLNLQYEPFNNFINYYYVSVAFALQAKKSVPVHVSWIIFDYLGLKTHPKQDTFDAGYCFKSAAIFEMMGEIMDTSKQFFVRMRSLIDANKGWIGSNHDSLTLDDLFSDCSDLPNCKLLQRKYSDMVFTQEKTS